MAHLDEKSNYGKLAMSRVLVVEDNPENQKIVRLLLERYRLDIDVANNGREAIDRLNKACYDLVLMDIQMPVMDGLEATRNIRKMPQYYSLPIIALTASNELQTARDCMNAGMNDYISKPIDFRILLTKICTQLRCDEIFDSKLPPIPIKAGDTENSAILLPECAGVDMAGTVEKLGISTEEFIDYAKGVTSSLKKNAQLLQTSISQENWEVAARTAHTLKGVASSIGAIKLCDLSFHLEEILGKNGRVDRSVNSSWSEDAGGVVVDIKLSIEMITQIIDSLPDTALVQEAELVSTEYDLVSELEKALKLSEEYDVSAACDVKALLSIVDSAHKSELGMILKDLEAYNFAEASLKLKKLLGY